MSLRGSCAFGQRISYCWVQRELIMKNNCLFAVALLSLALASGCAKGGNGVVPPTPSVSITTGDVSPLAIYPTQSLTFTATVSNSTNTAVTWSLSGTGCTGTPNPCGTLTPVTPAPTPATATYKAPATPISGVTATATLVSDTSIAGSLALNVVDITTDVAPATLSVGSGLTQQFTAVAAPDDAPQTFTWTCTANGVQCANFHQDSNVSGLAYYTYTPADSCSGNCVQILALSPLDTNGCTPNPKYCIIAKASLVTSRLSVNSTYAFQFSGYDSSQHPVMVAGNFTTDKTGAIVSGAEDVLTVTSVQQGISITGAYTPTSADPNNSNNAGTLKLYPGGVTQCGSQWEAYPCQYQVVLDGAGDIQMIESDNNGTGSGIAQESSKPSLFTGDQTYAFGFTGVDSGGNRVGFVGVLPMNDNGATSTVCGSPCSVAGLYSADKNIAGLWHMTLTAGTTTLDFDFFISSGAAGKTNPLTFYAISTDAVDATHPAVSGTMVLQDSSLTYNNAAFKGTSVSALTGTGTTANGTVIPGTTNVSLTLGSTDGNGNFGYEASSASGLGQFDQNNAGTIVTVPSSLSAPSFSYTYAASGTNGRYTFNMLGNPDSSPVQPALPFILYASGANRGFLLDQSSSSVMTGTMNPQGKGGGSFSNSELPGTYAGATTGSGSSAVTPIAANLLLTIQTTPTTGALTYNVSGTQYPGPPTVTGTYALSASSGDLGVGTIALTAPSAQNYVIYVLDSLGCSSSLQNPNPACEVQDFLMMDETTTPNPNKNASIIFAQQ
jgi:hypothetical protein